MQSAIICHHDVGLRSVVSMLSLYMISVATVTVTSLSYRDLA
jgi:hypothetical protein